MNKMMHAIALLLLPGLAVADPGLQAADTSWILTSTALVLFMTLPGLAMFYGGLVRSKNVLSILLQCFSIAAIMSILWLIVGYSIAFSEGNDYFGGFSKVMLAGVQEETLSGGLPESLFALFQMTFAIITPALIIGAFAERIKFSAVLLFSALWLLVVYAPVTRWLAGQYGVTRFCRWHSRAYYGWCCGIGGGTGYRSTARFSGNTDDAAQHDHDYCRCRHAVGWMVRI